MTNKHTRRGFTLIELLVVVLIIGILAAIALPQYQKAVAKARMMEIVTTLKTIGDAHQMCYLREGRSCDRDELDVKIPRIKPECKNFLDGTPSACPDALLLTDRASYFLQTEDADGHAVWAIATPNVDEDVCFCHLKSGEIVVTQNTDSCADGKTKYDYAALLNLRDESGAGCVCC